MGRVGGRGQEDRPRERALREGVAVLSDRELLAAVLGVGGPGASALELAEDLAGRGLRRLARATPGELLQTGGLGPAQAARLAAAFELGRRAAARGPGGRRLDSSRALARVARQRLQGEEHEVVLVILLTAGLRLLRTVPVARGGGCAAAFAPADVLRVAIREGAPRLALAHNHPGGDPTPSPADLLVTARLEDAARLLGLDLVDHVVLGDRGRFVSLMSALRKSALRRGS